MNMKHIIIKHKICDNSIKITHQFIISTHGKVWGFSKYKKASKQIPDAFGFFGRITYGHNFNESNVKLCP